MIFKTNCDMGNVKIFNNTVSLFFDNGVGDVPTIVEVLPKPKNESIDGEFLGHFTVKTEAFLSSYDCDDSPLYEFGRGRWFVYRIKVANLKIIKQDEDIYA